MIHFEAVRLSHAAIVASLIAGLSIAACGSSARALWFKPLRPTSSKSTSGHTGCASSWPRSWRIRRSAAPECRPVPIPSRPHRA